MSIQLQKIEIVENNLQINFDTDQKLLKPINENANKIKLIDFLLDESFSSIPLFMRYFAVHECIVLFFGGLYWIQPDVGVICLSIFPGLSIIGIFLHFLLTQFKNNKVRPIIISIEHYYVALIIFILGLSSIGLIYHANTYLSTLVPVQLAPQTSTSVEIFFGKILKFPHVHSMMKSNDDLDAKPFNYRISFVGTVIAPVVEESFKYVLVSLTFPISFIWSFSKKQRQCTVHSSYSDYTTQSLFIMFIAVCGGSGIAIMENIGYLATCQWKVTKSYCLPNKNFDILGAGLARGIFSVPFHCVTACIMADILCMWMNTNICFVNHHKFMYIIKCILSYPICIIIPIFFHSSFNYWMKGMPFMTGTFTFIGFSFLASRIAKKHSFIKNEEKHTGKKNDPCMKKHSFIKNEEKHTDKNIKLVV